MSALIAWSCVAAYLTIGLLSARRWFGSIRPYREPIKCHYDYRGHEHIGSCYERIDTIDTQGIAVFVAICGGLFWPVTWLCVLSGPPLRRWFAKASPDLPEEVEAKISRMEKEMNL